MYISCPVDLKTVSNTVVRLNAAQISGWLILTILSGWWVIPFYLAVDFLIRLSPANQWSPTRFISYLIYQALNLPENPVDRAPKRFAASIGVVFSVASGAFLLLGWDIAATATLIVFLICALLEAVFNYCLGCVVWFWFNRPLVKRAVEKSSSLFQSAG